MSTSATSTTSSTTSTGGTVLRITGMVSGLDVDATVTKLMAVEQLKLDSLNQAQQLTTWKQTDYNSIISSIKDLQSSFMDVASPSTNILSQSNYSANDVTVDALSTSSISATAGSGAVDGSYSVAFSGEGTDTTGAVPTVLHTDGTIATAATVTGGALTTASTVTALGLSSTMSDLGTAADFPATITITYGTSTPKTTSNVSIASTDTLSDVINNISKATSGAVTGSFSQLTGTFSLKTSTTGVAQTIGVTGGSSLGLNDASGIKGTDAVVYITPPGSAVATRVDQSTNNFTIDGVSYNLLKVAASPSTFTITADTTKIHDQISSFLTKYNAIISTIQTKLSEKTDSAYPPLTSAQESSMSAADIATWNTKAQVGDLRNDTNLQNLLTSLRQAFTTPVTDSSGSSVSSVYFGNYGTGAIGIDTSDDVTQGAKITIVDDAKFTAAISANPNGVMNLFTNTSTAAAGSTANFNASGIFQRINNILVSNVGYTGTTLNTATLTQYANVQDDYSSSGSGGNGTIPDQIYDRQVQITNQTTAMAAKSEAYYMEFSNLESALSTLNSQSSILTQLTTTTSS